MEKFKALMFLLAISFILSSCKEIGEKLDGTIIKKNKEGDVKILNYSPYTEDNPVEVELKGNTLLKTGSVAKNTSVTFQDVPIEVRLTMSITDKKGRSVSIWFELQINETIEFKYKGEPPIEWKSNKRGEGYINYY
jgi:hypothetical protein